MINVGIVGGSGYGGVELIRLLQHHPNVNIMHIYSHSKVGQSIKETFPHLQHMVQSFDELTIVDNPCDVIFFATPSNVSKHWAPQLIAQGIHVIDLSGDFRLKHPDVYQRHYGELPADLNLLKQAHYGLAEWATLSDHPTHLVANPGCFPTASLLALHPLVTNEFVDLTSIIIDAKTGVSGAGRTLTQQLHFAEMNDNLGAYAIFNHKHQAEIEQYLTHIAKQDVDIIFTPHIVPMTRGILVTIYIKLNQPCTASHIHQLMSDAYKAHPFVRVRDLGDYPKTKEVQGSNYCDISVFVESSKQRAIIIATIDNLVKGASGQAIQNLNLLYNLDITTGLTQSPIYP